jgi:hypothetical protein
MIAKTPSPPYYAVIFSSVRTEGDNGYSEMSEKMLELALKSESRCKRTYSYYVIHQG